MIHGRFAVPPAGNGNGDRSAVPRHFPYSGPATAADVVGLAKPRDPEFRDGVALDWRQSSPLGIALYALKIAKP